MMKPSRIVLSIGILFLTVLPIMAQNCKCPEEAQGDRTALTVIGVNDYANFLNIDGLKKYSNIVYEGLNLTSNEVMVGYTLNSHSKDRIIFATYDKDGNLIKGSLITKNSPLPKDIRDHLGTENYSGWTMTSNKIIVHDFSAQKTEYEVKIRQGKMKKTLFFDHLGNPMTRLTRS